MITDLQCVSYSKTKHLKINQILKLKIKWMELEKFEYDNSIVKKFIIVTALFRLVGMLVDLTVASQLAWAGFFFNDYLLTKYISYGRIRPLHTNTVIFSGVYYSLPRLLKTPM